MVKSMNLNLVCVSAFFEMRPGNIEKSTRFDRSRSRRGGALLFSLFCLLLLLFAAALTVEWGRMQLKQAELQTAADAGALAGATAIDQAIACNDASIARAAATGTVAANIVDAASALAVAAQADVAIGRWDPDARAFAVLADDKLADANAVRVRTHACAERGNALELTATAWALESPTVVDCHAEAIAYQPLANVPRGFMGLDSFRSTGVLTTAAVPPGGYPTLLGPRYFGGHIYSNGDVDLHLLNLAGVTLVRGDVLAGGEVNTPVIDLLTKITGAVRKPATPFVAPPVDPDLAADTNDNDQLSTAAFDGSDFTALGIVNIEPGVYRVDDFTVLAGAVVNVRGPTTFVITGKSTVLGSVLSLNRRAGDLRILVAGDDAVDLAATADFYADLYAPESDVRITAGLRYTGRIVGRELNVLATSFLYVDPALTDPFAGVERVRLVE